MYFKWNSPRVKATNTHDQKSKIGYCCEGKPVVHSGIKLKMLRNPVIFGFWVLSRNNSHRIRFNAAFVDTTLNHSVIQEPPCGSPGVTNDPVVGSRRALSCICLTKPDNVDGILFCYHKPHRCKRRSFLRIVRNVIIYLITINNYYV
jgi:hypothetical protein